MSDESSVFRNGINSATNWLDSKGKLQKTMSALTKAYFINSKTDDQIYKKSRKITNLLLKYSWDIEYDFENEQTKDFIENKKSALYISNHHNILIDPLSIMCHIHKISNVKVHPVIGDNLHYENPVFNAITNIAEVIEMPRDTKHFLKIGKAYLTMFNYLDKGDSIWIAQKQGRSKIGKIESDLAIFDFFEAMGKRHLKANTLDDVLSKYPIVPVSLTYLNSPDEYLVAKQVLNNGSKGEKEDIKHMKIGANIFNLHYRRPKLIVKYSTPINSAKSSKNLMNKLDYSIQTGIQNSNYHTFALNELIQGILKYPYALREIECKYKLQLIKEKESETKFIDEKPLSQEELIQYGIYAQRANVAGLSYDSKN